MLATLTTLTKPEIEFDLSGGEEGEMEESKSASRVLHPAAVVMLAVFVAACKAATPAGEASNDTEPSTVTPGASRATTAPAPNRDVHHIVVQAGQSVSRLATEYHVPKDAIIAANQLTPPYTIKIGEKLVIPGSDGTPSVNAQTSPATVARPETRHLVVEAGQSVSRIAAEYHAPQESIIAANHLTPPYKIKIGDELVIPSAAISSTPPEVSSAHGSVSEPSRLSTAATSRTPQPPIEVATEPKATTDAAVIAPVSSEPAAASSNSPPAAPEPVRSSGGKLSADATATTALAVAAAPPGVTCPAGTVGMWSDRDVTKTPVYICHRQQSP